MAPVTITRTAWTDDDGSGTVGTIINNAEKTTLYGQIDTALAKFGAVSHAVAEGRLTLSSGNPVSTSDAVGGTNMIWTPFRGNRIGLYDGSSTWSILTFIETTLALGTLVNGQAYDVFAYNNSGTTALEALEWLSATVTITIAAPGVVTWASHGLTTGQNITLTTSGALPTGLAANTVYFVTVVDVNTFKLSTTQANLAAGTFITTSGTQSGTHTGHQPYQRATALVLQDGVLVKTGATTRRYLGTFVSTSTTTTEDSFAKRLVWNYYNRVKRPLRVVEATASWTYTTATLRQANASAANQVAVVVGVAESPIELEVSAATSNTVATNATVSIGEDSITASAATVVNAPATPGATSGTFYTARASLKRFPAVGYHAYAWLEYSAATGTTTWYGVSAPYVQSGISGIIES